MAWNFAEALDWYRSQGAPSDQAALTALLREVQEHSGGSIPKHLLPHMAAGLGVKESYLLALVKRLPSLRLSDTHVLELCAGPNCGKAVELAAFAEKLAGKGITVKFTPCMRLCGKGPNVKWDGKLYHKADKALLCRLMEEGI